MKIIHFIASIDKSAGGTTAYMQLLAAELKDLCELIVVTGTSETPVEMRGVKVQFFNLNMSRWFSIKQEFANFLKIEKPDIIHINGIWTPQNFLFQKIAQQLGLKVVLSPHGMLEPYILNRHPLKKKIALALYQDKAVRTANYIHATAQSELDQIYKLGYNQPAAIISNGIDISAVMQKTHWEAGARNILFLSRIHPKKGLELFIDAIAELNNIQIKVIIAGEGEHDYVEMLKKQTRQKGVSHLFNFVGGVYGDQKWELYQRSDLFILPTYSENFGIVVAEALATGMPVITTTGTPWKELETEKCGWWIELTVNNMKKVINEAISMAPEELKAMGLRGRKLVEEKYDIKAVAKKMKEFYQSILNTD